MEFGTKVSCLWWCPHFRGVLIYSGVPMTLNHAWIVCASVSRHPRFIHAGDGKSPCYVEPPMIQGHEFVGEVIKLGPGIIWLSTA